MGILDLVFPKYCVSCKKFGSYICDNCFSYLSFEVKTPCLVCSKLSLDSMTHKECKSKYAIDGCFSALSSSKTARKLIFSFKNRPYLIDLKKVLSNLFYEGIIQKEELIKELQKGKWVIVPVPLLETKLRKRGYNQAEILAKELGKRLNLPVENFLKRKANDKNEFEIIFYTKDVGLNILIVDDLVKTGSTLLECAKVLKRIGAKKAIGVTLIRN